MAGMCYITLLAYLVERLGRQRVDLNNLVVFDSQLTYTFPWFMSTARRTILSTASISFIDSKRSMKRCNVRLRHGDL